MSSITGALFRVVFMVMLIVAYIETRGENIALLFVALFIKEVADFFVRFENDVFKALILKEIKELKER